MNLAADWHEWSPDSPLLFKRPSLGALQVSANRLLKFEFPPSHTPQVYQRLLKTHLHSPGVSKRMLEELPLFMLERLYVELWRQTLADSQAEAPLSGAETDRQIALLLLAEQLMEYRAEELVRHDIALLGTQAPPGLHSYYFKGQMDRDTLLAILTQNQYQTTHTRAAHDEPGKLMQAYLIDRALSNPLPWGQLLDLTDANTLMDYPRLHRLGLLHQTLQHTPPKRKPALSGASPAKSLTAFTSSLQSDWSILARQSGQPRPVQTLVLVEGETEKLLLPLFAQTLGVDFSELGIYVLPAGGKNQMLGLYQKYSPVLNAPIFVVLDRDAAETGEALIPLCRPGDRVYGLAEGEFEDTYELKLILDTINRCYDPYPRLTPKEYAAQLEPCEERPLPAPLIGRVQELRHLWKNLNLGTFDKTRFAAQLAQTLQITDPTVSPPSLPIRTLIESILEVRHHAPFRPMAPEDH